MVQMIFLYKPQVEKSLSLFAEWIKMVKNPKKSVVMMMPLKEGKTGLSKFCGLYPRHIKTFDHIPNTVCLCTYNENLLTTSCGCSWAYQRTISLQLFC